MRVLAFGLLVACSSSPDKPPAGGEAPRPIDASTAPVSTEAAEPEFWTRGDAACPDGGKLNGSRPHSKQIYCHGPDGAMHGPSAQWNDEGQLVELSMMKNGKREGVSTRFHPDGTKQSEVSMRQNNQHGPHARWHPNGQKAYEGAYRDGRPHGRFRAWDQKGVELGSFEMVNGTGTLSEWHENGQKSFDQPMEDGQAHGTSIQWHLNGKKAGEMSFVRGEPHGRTSSWNDQGQKLQEGQYARGSQDGDWTHFDQAGAVIRIDTYSRGTRTATIEYQDGKPLGGPIPAQGKCATDDGLAAAYQAQSGNQLDQRHRCIHRAPHFPGLVLVGGFAHDRGCIQTGALLDCKLVKKVDPAQLLARAGWKSARAPARERIAMNYLREVQLAWSGSLSEEPDPPRTVTAADGGITITAWLNEPSGMQPGVTRHLTEIRFAAGGAVTTRVIRSHHDR
jgi:antitoxin component YwqK of YwqJK toxin-antitoxin module